MGLLLGTREKFVGRDGIAMVRTPDRTDTWRPVPHIQVIESLERSIRRRGWRIGAEQYGLARDNQKLFGVMSIANSDNPDWSRTIGIRNSHDKSLCVGITAGVNVLVCSNLAFGGTTVLQKRHTSGLDVAEMVESGVQALADSFLTLELALERLRGIRLDHDHARSLIVRIAEADAIPSCDILPAFNEFQSPRHGEFGDPSCWSLLNAITELSHKYAPARVDKCHRRLTRLFGLDGGRPVLQLTP
jgi:hypothetical protein